MCFNNMVPLLEQETLRFLMEWHVRIQAIVRRVVFPCAEDIPSGFPSRCAKHDFSSRYWIDPTGCFYGIKLFKLFDFKALPPISMSKINPYLRVLGITFMFLATFEQKLQGQGVDQNNGGIGGPPVLGQVPPLPEADESTLPAQSLPPGIQPVSDPASIYNLGPDTNLIRLLDDIRDLAKNGELDTAQSLAGRALEKIGRTEQNSFYLSQIRKEETCLLYTSPSPRDRTRSRMPSSA